MPQLTDPEFIESLRVLIEAHQAPPPPPVITSPTGREPCLLWTPKLQTTYNRMKADFDAGQPSRGAGWYRLIRDNANGNRYADSGLWATLMFQITGDPAWVPKALTKLQPFLTTLVFGASNDVREMAIERVILLDWLWPGLTPAQRDLHLARLDAMFTAAFVAPSLPPAMPIRTTDSDQTTGVYFGVACYAAAFGVEHPPAQAVFDRPFIGGYASTGRNRLTLRNTIRDYVEMAAGGEWIEGADYNLGTVKLLLLGAEGIRTATGVDHFPEVTAWKTAAAMRYAHMLTPDRRQSFQWGDEEHPHALIERLYTWVTSAMLFDDPHARETVEQLVGQYGQTGYQSAEPWARAFLQHDPYGSRQPLTTLPTVFDGAAGQGLVTARSSWQDDASQVMLHFPPTSPNGPVDHAVNYFGDVQLYRKGAWALTHPLSYGGVGNTGEGCNVMLHCGFGAPLESRTASPVEQGPGWVQMSGRAGGSMLLPVSNYYKIPNFWRAYSRVIRWVQGDVDTLTVSDLSDLDDPQLLPQFSHYSAALQATIKANPLRQWRWHCPVAPTVIGNVAEWPIPSGIARVTWLRGDLIATVVDQRVAWPQTSIAATEKKYHLQLTPAVNAPGLQTLTTILQFGDPTKFGPTLPK